MFLSELICFPSGIAFCMMSVFVHVRVFVYVRMLGEWQGKRSCFPDVRGRREMSRAGRTEEGFQFHSLVVTGISAVGPGSLVI